jgi:S-DNA-T family DNA segregation ATPase FtsK/SpoIIIE
LYLPFSEGKMFLNGPGGLVGQYLGQIAATFIGGVGAALASATLLCVAILLLTDIKVSEVSGVMVWASRWVGRSIFVGVRLLGRTLLAGIQALGRITVAMFPTGDRGEQSDDVGEGEEVGKSVPVKEKRAAQKLRQTSLSDEEYDEEGRLTEADSRALATFEPGYENGSLEQEEGFGYESELPLESEDRRAVAAVVAEVAAVDCALLVEPEREELIAEKSVASNVAILAPVTTTLDEGPTETTRVVSPVDQGPVILAPIAKPIELKKAEGTPDEGPGFIRLSDGAFKLPPSDMLEYQPPKNTGTDEESLRTMADRLEQALANYNVRGRVTAIQMGPVIITFEFAPAPGTRTGKIVQLENDLAMALEAQSVRIVAPIPGKAVVGIEIPNKQREMVYLKEILEEDGFRRSGAKLQICLGKDTKGTPVSVNLAKMPHLLVAGTTGSGKSVAVNGMITSILYSATPEEVRFIMVDPKMLELSIYEGIPHLLLPVVTDPKKAALALRWAVDEMERRYELLAKSGVRDISTYNAKIDVMEKQGVSARADAEPAEGNWLTVSMAAEDGTDREVEVEVESAAGGGLGMISEELDEAISAKAAAEQFAKQNAEPPPRKLPYIVIVIDEFADLMMVAAKDVDTAVARLAQKARAAGLHLILATQRPSVDVITGVIKANFPSRIALQVASQIDSRTIMGQPGAETLLGNGDMLFSDRGTKLKRIQGAFLSDDEVHRVVEFLKKQAKPVYDMNIITAREDEDGEGESLRSEFHDELYDQAVAIVCDTRQASVSYIQRRLQIGYNRAARMVEQLERDGIVGPSNGIRPRDVLAPQGEYLSQPTG